MYTYLFSILWFSFACSDKSEDTATEEPLTCDTTGLDAVSGEAVVNEEGWFLTSTTADGSHLSVQSWSNWGGPDSTGTYGLEGYNFQDCGLCLLLFTDCPEGAEPRLPFNTECETVYYADQGSVELSNIDLSEEGAITAVLSDVFFTEVTVSADDFVSTPVEDPDIWCVDGEYSGDVTIEEGSWSNSEMIGLPMPDLTAPDQNGNEVNLSDFQGTMLTLLFNANDWCPYCVNEVARAEALWQEMNAADERYDVSFVELLYDEPEPYEGPASQEDAAAWAEEYGLTYPVLHGADVQTYFDDNGPGAFPCYWIVDPLGQIRAVECGQMSMTSAKVLEHFESFLVENPDWTRE